MKPSSSVGSPEDHSIKWADHLLTLIKNQRKNNYIDEYSLTVLISENGMGMTRVIEEIKKKYDQQVEEENNGRSEDDDPLPLTSYIRSDYDFNNLSVKDDDDNLSVLLNEDADYPENIFKKNVEEFMNNNQLSEENKERQGLEQLISELESFFKKFIRNTKDNYDHNILQDVLLIFSDERLKSFLSNYYYYKIYYGLIHNILYNPLSSSFFDDLVSDYEELLSPLYLDESGYDYKSDDPMGEIIKKKNEKGEIIIQKYLKKEKIKEINKKISNNDYFIFQDNFFETILSPLYCVFFILLIRIPEFKIIIEQLVIDEEYNPFSSDDPILKNSIMNIFYNNNLFMIDLIRNDDIMNHPIMNDLIMRNLIRNDSNMNEPIKYDSISNDTIRNNLNRILKAGSIDGDNFQEILTHVQLSYLFESLRDKKILKYFHLKYLSYDVRIQLKNHFKYYLRGDLKIKFKNKPDSNRIEVIPYFVNRSENEVLYNKLSSGQKSLITMISWAYKYYKRGLIILDEVDKHLDPPLIKILLDIIYDAFLRRGINVIMTTRRLDTITLLREREVIFYPRSLLTNLFTLKCDKKKWVLLPIV